MSDKHLIVISVDALVYEDLEYAKTLPAFGKFLQNGSIINKVKTTYPSLTHSIHASIITGCPSGVTGVYSNCMFDIASEKKTWINFLNQIKCDTILHAAKRAGLTTAACRWPVTAGDSDVIDYLVPEFFAAYLKGYENDPVEAYKNIGSKGKVIDVIREMIERYGVATEESAFDLSQTEIFAAAEIIKKYKPNLMLIHPCYVDSIRHKTGLFSDEVKEAILVTDKWISDILKAVDEAGIRNSTDFVILSDHGHLNYSRSVSPNVFLADKGYITLDGNGKIASWRAYAASCGLSSQVYLADKTDTKLYNDVYCLLKKMAAEKIYGFERVFTVDEVRTRYGLYGEFSFVLETDGYTLFDESLTLPAVSNTDCHTHSSHGHMPEKGPQPPFIAMGPSFKKGVVIENGSILNHAPTFAKILGINLPDAYGRAVDEILR